VLQMTAGAYSDHPAISPSVGRKSMSGRVQRRDPVRGGHAFEKLERGSPNRCAPSVVRAGNGCLALPIELSRPAVLARREGASVRRPHTNRSKSFPRASMRGQDRQRSESAGALHGYADEERKLK